MEGENDRHRWNQRKNTKMTLRYLHLNESESSASFIDCVNMLGAEPRETAIFTLWDAMLSAKLFVNNETEAIWCKLCVRKCWFVAPTPSRAQKPPIKNSTDEKSVKLLAIVRCAADAAPPLSLFPSFSVCVCVCQCFTSLNNLWYFN